MAADKKIHIVNTPDPLKFGTNITANCGHIVPRAKQAFIWDETVIGEMIATWPMGTCRQCANISDKQREGRHFIYGLKHGAMDETAEAQ